MQREAIKGLLKKTGVAPTEIDYVSCGTVIQEVFTSNIAREAAMAAGIPLSTPAHTVTLACISSNVAMGTGIDKIKTGQVPPSRARVQCLYAACQGPGLAITSLLGQRVR